MYFNSLNHSNHLNHLKHLNRLKYFILNAFKMPWHVVWLAFRDYIHEWRMSSCFILALASVLAPMLLLFGLKFGIVTGMMDRLVEDPRNREIRPVGANRFDYDWFKIMEHNPDVAFVVPRTRSLSATIQLQRVDGGKILTVEQIPSAIGDPLLDSDAMPPQGFSQVVVSAPTARELNLKPGDTVDASIARIFNGHRERVHLTLNVVAVAPYSSFPRVGVFASIPLLTATEDFRDGRAVPLLHWQGDSAVKEDRTFSGFRLYARSIHDVARLREQMNNQGLKITTRAAEIEIVESIDHNLSIVFWIVVLVGFSGFSLSLGASLWANVERKQRELSILRLIGFRTMVIVWFPVIQALFTGFFGWLLAIVIYYGVASTINQLFISHAEVGRSICELLAIHFAIALGLTLCSATLAATLGGFRAARVEPSDGLREV